VAAAAIADSSNMAVPVFVAPEITRTRPARFLKLKRDHSKFKRPLIATLDQFRKRGHRWPKSVMGPACVSHGLMHRSKLHPYSITSSARVSSVGGTMIPSAFAVFKLITSSNLVGCSTGRSAAFAPLRILSTK
jgi:hypothetical protein